MKLELGKFYRARNGWVWCCFRENALVKEHARFDCILTEGRSARTEYFYPDGRYDEAGNREHTLIEEVPAGTKGTQ